MYCNFLLNFLFLLHYLIFNLLLLFMQVMITHYTLCELLIFLRYDFFLFFVEFMHTQINNLLLLLLDFFSNMLILSDNKGLSLHFFHSRNWFVGLHVDRIDSTFECTCRAVLLVDLLVYSFFLLIKLNILNMIYAKLRFCQELTHTSSSDV